MRAVLPLGARDPISVPALGRPAARNRPESVDVCPGFGRPEDTQRAPARSVHHRVQEIIRPTQDVHSRDYTQAPLSARALPQPRGTCDLDAHWASAPSDVGLDRVVNEGGLADAEGSVPREALLILGLDGYSALGDCARGFRPGRMLISGFGVVGTERLCPCRTLNRRRMQRSLGHLTVRRVAPATAIGHIMRP